MTDHAAIQARIEELFGFLKRFEAGEVSSSDPRFEEAVITHPHYSLTHQSICNSIPQVVFDKLLDMGWGESALLHTYSAKRISDGRFGLLVEGDPVSALRKSHVLYRVTDSQFATLLHEYPTVVASYAHAVARCTPEQQMWLAEVASWELLVNEPVCALLPEEVFYRALADWDALIFLYPHVFKRTSITARKQAWRNHPYHQIEHEEIRTFFNELKHEGS